MSDLNTDELPKFNHGAKSVLDAIGIDMEPVHKRFLELLNSLSKSKFAFSQLVEKLENEFNKREMSAITARFVLNNLGMEYDNDE